MHALRTSSVLPRLALAWFVLMLGVAAGSPQLGHSRAMEVVVCSAADSARFIIVDGDGLPVETGPHTLDCPLCLPAFAPLPAASLVLPTPQPLAHAAWSSIAADIAALVGAPLPARGPPYRA
ncbi:MAG TPA: hypothetical protein PK177_06310 [Burkholderiaceae bacterium]|nr:hypothetical protein [Burkholderiaceae bacterium]